MRLFKILLVTLFAMITATGCVDPGEATAERVQQTIDEGHEAMLDESAGFSVFLAQGATEQQKAGVRAWLESRPEVTGITFEDSAAAYARFKKLWADDPEFTASVSADSLPESFRVETAQAAAAREIRDGPAGAELKALPGVRNVVFPCTTYQECLNDLAAQRARPSPSN